MTDAVEPGRADIGESDEHDQYDYEATALSIGELRSALLRPDIAIEIAVGSRDRVGRNLSTGSALWWVATLLFTVSVVTAIPYGLAVPGSGLENWPSIAVLFLGSVAICYPSLYVFSQFLGFGFRTADTVVVALLVSSVAAAFSLGFAPIIWFIDATTEGPDTALPVALSFVLLSVSFMMGLLQMSRCAMLGREDGGRSVSFPLVMLIWMALLAFITFRMSGVLGLR